MRSEIILRYKSANWIQYKQNTIVIEMKKQPKCIYGHGCYSVCINSQCTMPAFMCETGSKQFDECGSFHQKCQRIIWTDIENVINRNPKKKLKQFEELQQKCDQLFFKIIKTVQEQHLKFKTWIATYGHSIETMKFIKNINDDNYKFIDGKFMDMIMTDLFSGEKVTIQAPRIRDLQLNTYFDNVKRQVQSLSNIYLKLPMQKEQSSNHSSEVSSKKSKSNEEISRLQLSRLKTFDSLIIEEISQINQFFDIKIKSLKLLYRASDFHFSTNEFHNRCDNIPHTLTLVENQYGKRLGGYTPLVWNKEKKCWSVDKEKKTFIFSLDLKEKYKLNLPQFAIANNPQRGPIFGCCDLFLSDNADKEKSGCEFPISFNKGKYVRKPETSEILTGTRTGKFLVKEWEVFMVYFKE